MLGHLEGHGQLVRAAVVHVDPSRRDAACRPSPSRSGTLAIILGFKRFVPAVPGAIVAVVLSIIVSRRCRCPAHGVAVVGTVQGGFPPIGLPPGIGWSDIPGLAGVAFSCFVLIIAQSAATSRSFASRHGERVDINRDIVGLSGANVAAGLSGTFVVNGSPTKTQILDEQKGTTQVANMTMSVVVLVVAAVPHRAASRTCPRRCWARSSSSSASTWSTSPVSAGSGSPGAASSTSRSSPPSTVFAVGVEQGIVLAIVLSIVEMVRRQYRPHQFVVGVTPGGEPTYARGQAGHAEPPGLLVFRYDADLFYANANQFSDERAAAHLQRARSGVVADPRLLVDPGRRLLRRRRPARASMKFVHTRGATFALAAADPNLRATLSRLGVLDELPRRTTSSTPWRTPWPPSTRPGSPGHRLTTRGRTHGGSDGAPSLGATVAAAVTVAAHLHGPRRRGAPATTPPPRCSRPRRGPRRARPGCGPDSCSDHATGSRSAFQSTVGVRGQSAARAQPRASASSPRPKTRMSTPEVAARVRSSVAPVTIS